LPARAGIGVAAAHRTSKRGLVVLLASLASLPLAPASSARAELAEPAPATDKTLAPFFVFEGARPGGAHRWCATRGIRSPALTRMICTAI
jgi:hypothetical protein